MPKADNILFRKPELWLLPFFVLPFLHPAGNSDPSLFFTQMGMAALLFTGFGVFLWGRIGGQARSLRVFSGPLSLIYLVLLGVGGLSVLWAVNPEEALAEWSKWWLSFGLFLLFRIVFSASGDFVLALGRMVLAFAGILLLWGCAEWATLFLENGFSHADSYEVRTVFAHRNLYAHILVLCYPFLLFQFLREKKFLRWLALAAMGVTVFVLMFLMVRTAWLAFVLIHALLLPLIWRIWRRRRGEKRSELGRRLRLFLLLALLGSAGGIAVFLGSDRSTSDFQKHTATLTDYSYGSAKERLVLWEKSWALYQKKPLTGYGLGNWKVKLPETGLDSLRPAMARAAAFFVRAHNDYLQLLVETGPVGAVAFLLLLCWPILWVVRAAWGMMEVEQALFLACMAGGLLAFSLIAALSFPMERMTHLLFLNLMLAGVAVFWCRRGERVLKAPLGLTLQVLLLLAMIFPLVVSWQRWQADRALNSALSARAKGDWQAMSLAMIPARRAFYPLDPSGTPLAWYSGLAHFNSGDAPAALRDFRQAYAAHPHHPQVLNNLASCLVQQGQLDSAAALYTEARRIAPAFPDPVINLVIVRIEQKQFEKALAIAEAEAIVREDPRFELIVATCLDGISDALMEEMDRDVAFAALRNISRYKPWLQKIYENSKEQGHAFREQLLIDTIYFLLHVKKSINLDEAGVLRVNYGLPKLE